MVKEHYKVKDLFNKDDGYEFITDTDYSRTKDSCVVSGRSTEGNINMTDLDEWKKKFSLKELKSRNDSRIPKHFEFTIDCFYGSENFLQPTSSTQLKTCFEDCCNCYIQAGNETLKCNNEKCCLVENHDCLTKLDAVPGPRNDNCYFILEKPLNITNINPETGIDFLDIKVHGQKSYKDSDLFDVIESNIDYTDSFHCLYTVDNFEKQFPNSNITSNMETIGNEDDITSIKVLSKTVFLHDKIAEKDPYLQNNETDSLSDSINIISNTCELNKEKGELYLTQERYSVENLTQSQDEMNLTFSSGEDNNFTSFMSSTTDNALMEDYLFQQSTEDLQTRPQSLKLLSIDENSSHEIVSNLSTINTSSYVTLSFFITLILILCKKAFR